MARAKNIEKGASRRERNERRRKLGESLFAVLLMVLPEAFHLPLLPWGLTLWCIAWVIGMHLLAQAHSFESWTAWQKLVCVIYLTIAGAEFAASPMYQKWCTERSEALEGDLYLGASQSRAPLVGFGVDGPVFLIGSSGELFDLFNDTGIKVETINGHLLLSTEVHDAQGKLVVNVTRNHWSVNPEKSICLDKNYTADSLEVKDGRGHIVLQVRLYPYLIRMQGEFFNSVGSGIEFIEDRKTKGLKMIFLKTPYDIVSKEELIPASFKYPSSQHWAERY